MLFTNLEFWNKVPFCVESRDVSVVQMGMFRIWYDSDINMRLQNVDITYITYIIRVYIYNIFYNLKYASAKKLIYIYRSLVCFFFKFQLFPGFGDPGTYLNEHLPMWQPWKNVNHCKAIMSALIFFQVPCMFYPCNRHLNRLVAFESNRKHHGPTVIVCPSDAFWSMHQKLNVEWCDPRRCSYHLVRVGQPVDVGKRRKKQLPLHANWKNRFWQPTVTLLIWHLKCNCNSRTQKIYLYRCIYS